MKRRLLNRALALSALAVSVAASPAQSVGTFQVRGQLSATEMKLEFNQFGVVNAVTAWSDPASGREFAIIGSSLGTRFVDVTDPSAPRFLGNEDTTRIGNYTFPADYEVVGNYAFRADYERNRLDRFDLGELLGAGNDPRVLHPETISNNPDSVAGIATRNRLYLIKSPTVSAFDVSENVTQIGQISNAGLRESTAFVYQGPDSQYQNRELVIATRSAPGSLSIMDFSDPTAPALISVAPPLSGNASAWDVRVTADHSYALVANSEGGRLHVIDLRDLETPRIVGSVTGNDWQGFIDEIEVRGSYVYVSNHRSGLSVLDTRQATSGAPVINEVGGFDFQTTGLGLINDVDPSLPSGNVLVALDDGLVVLSPLRAPADGNWDGHIDGADFTLWSDNFGAFGGDAQPSDGDYTGDGLVTGADFTVWSDYFGRGALDDLPPAIANVPEPNSRALLASLLAALALSRARLRLGR